jgi:hypothetical protein
LQNVGNNLVKGGMRSLLLNICKRMAAKSARTFAPRKFWATQKAPLPYG